ncbi:hypothetical protein [Pontibacter ramchanderi]|uniref:Collagen triple helix repeat protein n=1 Tax=Pontibacter ramchanderi TaxID=1179743 RepID=A0A2N3U983_9BACT|nr:hypothetical protein [Pontibacter ramchanderi]PKV63302.1 hypothetical protein BD749_3142 [Pontibacter ramchanderi]
MPKTLLIPIASALLALSFSTTFAQQRPLSKLVVAKGETYVAGPDNIILVDTLIMQDRATIKFDPSQYGVLEAKVAYIGQKCLISSKGTNGSKGNRENAGSNGANGGDLTVSVHLAALGSLIIDTSGGDGGRGADGNNGAAGIKDRHETRTVTDPVTKQTTTTTVLVPGQPGTAGSDATMGGSGGNGGNLTLQYSTGGFIPIFNNEAVKKNSIRIHTTGGRQGQSGQPGKGGFQRADGGIKFSEIIPSSEGKIMLINRDAL